MGRPGIAPLRRQTITVYFMKADHILPILDCIILRTVGVVAARGFNVLA